MTDDTKPYQSKIRVSREYCGRPRNHLLAIVSCFCNLQPVCAKINFIIDKTLVSHAHMNMKVLIENPKADATSLASH